MQKTILVIGATGMLGEPVARKLKEDGFKVRVLARDVSKAEKMFDEAFEIVRGDVLDTESLEKAIDGCFGVHINLSGEIEQQGVERVVSVASHKSVKRITYISGTSVFEENTWFPQTRQKYFAEKAIRESGIPYNIFCPTWFMESLPRYVKGNKAFAFGKNASPFHFVAARDYARMVSRSYKHEKAFNRRFFIHGPEGIPFRDALKRYCSVFHPEIKKISTYPYWFARIIAAIKRSKKMRFAVEFMKFFEKAGEGGDPTEANRLLGAPQTTLDQWLKQKKG